MDNTDTPTKLSPAIRHALRGVIIVVDVIVFLSFGFFVSSWIGGLLYVAFFIAMSMGGRYLTVWLERGKRPSSWDEFFAGLN
jgi:hypothetical protein